jgi:hypothetical protein
MYNDAVDFLSFAVCVQKKEEEEEERKRGNCSVRLNDCGHLIKKMSNQNKKEWPNFLSKIVIIFLITIQRSLLIYIRRIP